MEIYLVIILIVFFFTLILSCAVYGLSRALDNYFDNDSSATIVEVCSVESVSDNTDSFVSATETLV